MNKKELRYSILKRLDEGHKNINFESFKAGQDSFEEQVYFLRDEGYLRNVEYFYDGMNLSDAKVTGKGEQYLLENSSFGKIYKTAKEIRGWF